MANNISSFVINAKPAVNDLARQLSRQVLKDAEYYFHILWKHVSADETGCWIFPPLLPNKERVIAKLKQWFACKGYRMKLDDDGLGYKFLK
jgi:hypothetical protein